MYTYNTSLSLSSTSWVTYTTNLTIQTLITYPVTVVYNPYTIINNTLTSTRTFSSQRPRATTYNLNTATTNIPTPLYRDNSTVKNIDTRDYINALGKCGVDVTSVPEYINTTDPNTLTVKAVLYYGIPYTLSLFDNTHILNMFMSNLMLESIGFTASKQHNACTSQDNYCGRGFIQLTGLDNYSSASLAITNDSQLFVKYPDTISQSVKYSWNVSTWYWNTIITPLHPTTLGQAASYVYYGPNYIQAKKCSNNVSDGSYRLQYYKCLNAYFNISDYISETLNDNIRIC
jgi:hypothetical protein